MKKAMVIINPTSGGEKALDYKEKLENKAKEYFEYVETKITEKALDATHFAEEASREQYDAVVVFGGDGTVNEVISGIAERDYIPKLGIIPGGTGNLITKLLEINQDIDGAIDELDFNLTNKIDIGKANDNYFGYIFSIGSLPEAIHNVEIEDKTKFGILAYAVNTMKSVMTDQVFNIKVETENGNYVGEASHVLVLLTNYFADKKIFEENKDGYANILILKDASLFSKLSVIPDLLKGDVVANDNIEYIRARNIKISSDSELESDVDGDKSDNLPVEIKVLAQRVEVFSKPKEEQYIDKAFFKAFCILKKIVLLRTDLPCKLIKIRKYASEIIQHGKYSLKKIKQDVVALEWKYEGQILKAIFNQSKEDYIVEKEAVALASNCQELENQLVISPKGFVIFH